MEFYWDLGVPVLLAAKVPCSPTLARLGTAPSGSPRVGLQTPRASRQLAPVLINSEEYVHTQMLSRKLLNYAPIRPLTPDLSLTALVVLLTVK